MYIYVQGIHVAVVWYVGLFLCNMCKTFKTNVAVKLVQDKK